MSISQFYQQCASEGRAVVVADRWGQPVRWVTRLRDEQRELGYWLCSARSGVMARLDPDTELSRITGRLRIVGLSFTVH